MSLLGEVVFCVDCDRARSADASAERPRRMATKKDANGDPLCTPCLDSRQAQRRAEFMLHEGRAPIPGQALALAKVVTAPSALPPRKLSLERITRTRPSETEPDTAKKQQKRPEKRPAPSVAAKRVTAKALPAKRAASSGNLRLARQFVAIAAEIGFLRAQELLDRLAASQGGTAV
jgi:hypothetical protein